MLYKIIYILVIISPMFSQSFFNRIIPEELYYNDAKSMSMGRTNISIGSNSGSIISNPSLLSNNEDGIHLDMSLGFNSISERRSIIFKDDWEETLGETDYAFNQNNYFSNRFGLTYSVSLWKFKVTGSISQNPFLSLNYNYEEEIRDGANLSDGVIGIKDPIVGYQSYSTSGILDVQSAGISFSFKTDKRKDYSIGLGVNNILDTKLIDEIKLTVIDDSHGLEHLSLMDDIANTYTLGANRRFHTLGAQIPIANTLVLTLSYEENVLLGSNSIISDNFQVGWSNITGLPSIFGYIEEELTYLPIGFLYQKPEKRNLGFTYYPELNVNMTLVFEIANKYWDYAIPGFTTNEINEYKLGFEYALHNSYPIRAGLVYSESIFNAIEPKAILTLGTGGKVGKVEYDLAMNYSITKYKYFDIFPLEDIYNLSCDDIGCDNVTDNKLSFLTTFRIGF